MSPNYFISICETTNPLETIKRKDDDSKTMFFEMIDESEIKGFSYYSKKLKEAKTKEESRRYAREIIFNYIKKV